jgi:ATP-dependent helicase HrpB
LQYHFAHGEILLECRLQELFGQKMTPTIMGGTQAITLNLLSPAYRPVQKTRDLQSFWQGVYPEIRPTLARKYPRHYWPEDPITAEPIQGPLKRKK